MRIRLPLFLCALVALLLAAGCERPEGVGLTAEVDEANYRRGKELLRQGRSQEALSSFLKVIEKRGDGAPESHLEVGLLYQNQIKDPIAAIYHYRKFRELKPNAPQADLVRQQIEAAMREFGRTLPAQPLENQLLRNDQLDVIESLRRENTDLKNELAIARANAASAAPRGTVAQIEPLEDVLPAQPDRRAPYATADQASPITRVPSEPDTATSIIQPPTRPTAPAPTPPTAAAGRRHVVAAKESLYSIARKYYGTPTNAKIDEIVAANRNVLPEGRNTALRVGMELRIP